VERGDIAGRGVYAVKKRSARDFALIGTVFAEVGRGRITTAFIRDGKNITDGYYDGNGHIYINEDHQTADTLIHECLHRAYPKWSEVYVRRTTSYIRLRMSDEEVMTLIAVYRKRARRRKRPVNMEDS
jgi:hypothetical protein